MVDGGSVGRGCQDPPTSPPSKGPNRALSGRLVGRSFGGHLSFGWVDIRSARGCSADPTLPPDLLLGDDGWGAGLPVFLVEGGPWGKLVGEATGGTQPPLPIF